MHAESAHKPDVHWPYGLDNHIPIGSLLRWIAFAFQHGSIVLAPDPFLSRAQKGVCVSVRVFSSHGHNTIVGVWCVCMSACVHHKKWIS